MSVSAVPQLSVQQLWRCLYQSEDDDMRVVTKPGHEQANDHNNDLSGLVVVKLDCIWDVLVLQVFFSGSK